MRDEICFVQFIHPGGEHRPDDGVTKHWNRDKHRRKFLLSPGRCVRAGAGHSGELVFWGEWEPESEVVSRIKTPIPEGPRFIYRPYYVRQPSLAGLQNTDPFVFGGFYYTNCMQVRKTGPKLRYLDRGSVILFGSHRKDRFVIDTVFVVADWIDDNWPNWHKFLAEKVPKALVQVTLDVLHAQEPASQCGPAAREMGFRLYVGATKNQPYDGMFSFFPCMPAEQATCGFARPAIRSESVTDTQREGYRLTTLRDPRAARPLWSDVVSQVEKRGLWLGVEAGIPEARAAPPQEGAA